MANTLWYDSTSDLTTIKNELGITDSEDDTLINDYGAKANRKIDNIVFGILDNIPTTESSEITAELKQAAILDIARRYKIKQSSFEAAKEYDTDFDEIIKSVKVRAKAEPTDREEIVVAESEYKSQPLKWRSELFG